MTTTTTTPSTTPEERGDCLRRKRGPGGPRDYLQGEPVHCGTVLELGLGDGRWIHVRYEVAGRFTAVLHLHVKVAFGDDELVIRPHGALLRWGAATRERLAERRLERERLARVAPRLKELVRQINRAAKGSEARIALRQERLALESNISAGSCRSQALGEEVADLRAHGIEAATVEVLRDRLYVENLEARVADNKRWRIDASHTLERELEAARAQLARAEDRAACYLAFAGARRHAGDFVTIAAAPEAPAADEVVRAYLIAKTRADARTAFALWREATAAEAKATRLAVAFEKVQAASRRLPAHHPASRLFTRAERIVAYLEVDPALYRTFENELYRAGLL